MAAGSVDAKNRVLHIIAVNSSAICWADTGSVDFTQISHGGTSAFIKIIVLIKNKSHS